MEQILKSRYRIGEKISENPFSVTYRGFYIGTDRPVVIKIYKRGTLNSSLIREMRQKVRDFSLINHHGIAKVIDGDYGWQGFYYVREYIEGQSVQDIFDRAEKIGVERAAAIADQALAALEVVHAKAIVHGALKPSNIFIDNQGIVKVADFVIESEVKDALPQKALEVLHGAKYSSPEELEGIPSTPASDLFSLGLILQEMAQGKMSQVTGGIAGNYNKLRDPAYLGPDHLAGLPPYLSEIICRALQKDPLLRIATAAEFRLALEQRSAPAKPQAEGEYRKIFETSVTQYGGEEIDRESEALQDVGRIRLRWSREKHRNWILSLVVGTSVLIGILYTFLFSQ